MDVAIMGSGGIGGYVGGRLAEIGERVHFVARGRQLEAMRRNGLRIESPLGDTVLPAVSATSNPGEIGPVDLVVFAVKLGDTEAAAALLAPLIGAGTRVVTLQNGIDSHAMLARHVGASRVAAGAIYISTHIREPGVIASPGGPHRMIVDSLAGDPLIAAFVAACNRATALTAEASDSIGPVIWEKFVRLSAFSGITCLTRRPIGATFAHPQSLAFLRALLEENVAVAQAAGQPIAGDVVETALAVCAAMAPQAKSSMLVDLEAGRPLELPWLSGRVVELGRSSGVATPANAAVVAALAPHAGGADNG